MKSFPLFFLICLTALAAACSRQPEAGGGASSTTPSAPPPAMTPIPAPSAESQAAADEIEHYLQQHQAELKSKIEALHYDVNAGPDEVEKFRQVLPAALAARFDLARPAMVVEAARGAMVYNLNEIKFAMLDYLSKTGRLPATLGEWAAQMAKQDPKALGYFLEPWTKVPELIAKAPPAEQATWVNGHTIYQLIDGGRGLGPGNSTNIVMIEKLDRMPDVPKVLVLYGDHVELVTRAELTQEMLQRQ